ncbi:MAG: NIPSNAP family protein [Cyclobacteriaceae bacterium]|nr:NIPSNAP family protein [Cyclobacteriaceae bacterium]
MKLIKISTYVLLLTLLGCNSSKKEETVVQEAAVETDVKAINPIYELREYYAAEGKLENLLTRFRDHTVELFKKHGMENVGYWVPTDNKENKLIYLLSYENKEIRDKAWKAFRTDTVWQKVFQESRVEGPLVDSVKITFLNTEDFSPDNFTSEDIANRTFELRIYHTNENKLSDLHDRFRNHTIDLFEKHHIRNIAYWSLAEGEENRDNILLYIVAHSSEEEAKTSWENFVNDPDWKAAYEASIVDGSLVDFIESTYMTPTDFSPLK